MPCGLYLACTASACARADVLESVGWDWGVHAPFFDPAGDGSILFLPALLPQCRSPNTTVVQFNWTAGQRAHERRGKDAHAVHGAGCYGSKHVAMQHGARSSLCRMARCQEFRRTEAHHNGGRVERVGCTDVQVVCPHQVFVDLNRGRRLGAWCHLDAGDAGRPSRAFGRVRRRGVHRQHEKSKDSFSMT